LIIGKSKGEYQGNFVDPAEAVEVTVLAIRKIALQGGIWNWSKFIGSFPG
jgi:hypothetical protein